MKEKIRVQIDLDLEIIANAVVRNVVNNVSEQTEETIVAKLTEEAVKAERKRLEAHKPNKRIYNNNLKNGNQTRIMRASRDAVYKAIKRGAIIRPDTCSNCGNGSHEVIHGHHECYRPENRLNVIWLCRSCHHKLHENKKNNGGTSCREQELRYH